MAANNMERLNRGTIVYHVFGTNVQKIAGNWLPAWRKAKKLKTGAYVQCCHIDCSNEATHGAHVQIAQGAIEAAAMPWLIVPACSDHNIGKNGKCMRVRLTKALYASETLEHKWNALSSKDVYAWLDNLFNDAEMI